MQATSSTSNTSTNERNNQRPKNRRTTFLPKPAFDEQLPEGVDFSEGGWATDFALSLLGLLFFISALQRDEQQFLYMFAGTAVAHFGGGLAHRFFPNRGSDGEGQVGFYVCMVLGAITVIYTSMGGLRAVVLTDVVQTLILFGGAILTLVLVSVYLGGVSAWWPTGWMPHWPEPVWGYQPGAKRCPCPFFPRRDLRSVAAEFEFAI